MANNQSQEGGVEMFRKVRTISMFVTIGAPAVFVGLGLHLTGLAFEAGLSLKRQLGVVLVSTDCLLRRLVEQRFANMHDREQSPR